MKTEVEGNFQNWETRVVCPHCQAEHVVSVQDVWAAAFGSSNRPIYGLICECSRCGQDCPIFPNPYPPILETLVPDGKAAWKGGAGSCFVPEPGHLLNRPEIFATHSHHPAKRLLEGIVSILRFQFRNPGDEVLVDLVATWSNDQPARPEFAGCRDKAVIAEVTRRLDERGWKVEPVSEDDDPPYRLFITHK